MELHVCVEVISRCTSRRLRVRCEHASKLPAIPHVTKTRVALGIVRILAPLRVLPLGEAISALDLTKELNDGFFAWHVTRGRNVHSYLQTEQKE